VREQHMATATKKQSFNVRKGRQAMITCAIGTLALISVDEKNGKIEVEIPAAAKIGHRPPNSRQLEFIKPPNLDDHLPITPQWLLAAGYGYCPANGTVIPLDDDDPQYGTVLVLTTSDGWIMESPYPDYETLILPRQPRTRGDL